MKNKNKILTLIYKKKIAKIKIYNKIQKENYKFLIKLKRNIKKKKNLLYKKIFIRKLQWWMKLIDLKKRNNLLKRKKKIQKIFQFKSLKIQLTEKILT